MATESQILEFINAYKTCALWSTNDETNERGGDPLDQNYDTDDIREETALDMENDCRMFIASNQNLLDQVGDYSQHGHDFFLSRNGHGAGFFDRDYPKEIGDTLQKHAREYGEYNLFIGPGEEIWHY